ncbi:nudt9 protein [Gigaspora margarita]|uniref:Nudt9 protein n=1 Tax=Gigaspora margarita TaxID=4874 RepID=A0A8H4A0S3_GIGMA|nr:nudt9 protein [Gigaspora margarita]
MLPVSCGYLDCYIFSKLKISGKYQWTCKNCIELEKYYYCRYKINKNGTLFMYFDTPHVITQWNLITRKFEMLYIPNLNLFPNIFTNWLEMNRDNTLLAIAFFTESKSIAVYVYSTKSGIEIANKTFSDENGKLNKFCFIGSREKERLLISYWNSNTKNYVTYILNPLTYTLDKSPDTNVLHDILNQNYVVINDYIIKIDKNELSIKRLSQNENWKNYLQSKERYVGSTFFNAKEIKQFIQDTLDKYKSNQFLTHSYSDVSEYIYSGQAYTWIVTNKYYKYIKRNQTCIRARIQSNLKETSEITFTSHDSANSYTLEIKMLKNDDIIFVSSSGIRIFSVNSEISSIELIYFWKEDAKNAPTQEAQQSIVKHLISFYNKLDLNTEILPTPNLDDYNYYSTLKNNEIALKFYGKEIIQQLVQWNKNYDINEILDNCYKYSLSMYESGDINNFLLFISQIAFALVELEKYNKDLRATENFLLKINLLIIKDSYFRYINNSLLSHLQHYRIYVYSYLSSTSFFDHLLFWIYENWNLLKKYYPKIYKILKSPYLFYLSYFTNYSQKTVRLIFPLLNFATYSQNYSYYELLYLYDNSFTLLNETNYYKLLNIKALINFKWNTYGKYYYFLIWTIYSIFMGCFLILSTISKDEISRNTYIFLLIVIIFLGFFYFIFEVRQFIHKPIHYITSPWNWSDLAAILIPTIISITWLYNKTLPVEVIAIANLFLEIKFILYFRFVDRLGIYFAAIIDVARQIFLFFFCIVLFTVLAFSHSFHLLLRPTSKYSYNQPSYTNDINNPWNLVPTYQSILPNGTIEGKSFIETPDKNTNMFTNFGTSILAVYFMLTGDTSAISSWVLENNWILAILLFLSKIELFWMLPYQRRKPNWFPKILYYEASDYELKKYINNIKNDEEIFQNLLPIIKIIAEIKDTSKEIEDTIKAQIDESLNYSTKAKIDESLKDILKAQIDESLKDILEDQINKALKDPIDKFNRLIKFIEKKESE